MSLAAPDPDAKTSCGVSVGDVVKRRQERSQLEAAVRRAAGGKSRVEAREILIAEHRRRGEEPLGQPLLDRQLDAILTQGTPADWAILQAEGVAAVVGMGTGLVQLFRSAQEDDWSEMVYDVTLVSGWHRTYPVILDPDAQDWVGEMEPGLLTFRDLPTVQVLQRTSAPRADGGEIVGHIGERRVGVLNDADADPFWEVLTEAQSGRAGVGSAGALRSRDTDGSWRLDLGTPKRNRPPFPPEEDQ